MNIAGRLLKYQRLKKRLKQEYVCHGLCTVSHLSKIENGKVNAPSDLIHDLFKKLEITFHDDEDFIGKYNTLIQDGFQALIYNRDPVELSSQLSEVHDKLMFSPLFIDYLNYKTVYIYHKYKETIMPENKRLEALNNIKLLLQLENVINQSQRGWLYFLLAISDIDLDTINNSLSMPLKSKDDCFVWAHAMLQSSIVLISRMSFHYYYGSYDMAISVADEATHYALKEGNASALALINFIIGNCYSARGMIEEMLPHYQRAYQLFVDLNNIEIQIGINYNLGATYLENNHYEQAEVYLIKCLNYDEISQSFLFSVYEKLTLLYGDTKQIEKGKTCLSKAESAFAKLEGISDDISMLYDYRIKLAKIRLRENYLNNEEYAKVVKSLCQELKANKIYPWGYFNFYKRYLYELYCHNRQYKKALALMNESN